MTKSVPIKNKVALVTGANRGIGRALTLELLKRGAKRVYACARNKSTLDELVNEDPDRIQPIQLDVTNDKDISHAAGFAADIELLFNNAGIIPMGNFLSGNAIETLQANLDVNVIGLAKVTAAFVKPISHLPSGAIVSFSSMAGLGNMPMMLTYSASKAAVHSIMQGLRAELQHTNVLVACVYPGPIDTEMTRGFDIPKDTTENVASNVMQGIEAGTEDIFPDAMSHQMGQLAMSAPKELEQQFSQFQ